MTFNFLVGNKVTLIKISRYQLILIFENSISISIESGMVVQSTTGEAEYEPGNFSEIKEVLELLEKKVTDFVESENELKIFFESDSTLILQNTNGGYESYIITHGDQTYVVGK